MNLEAGSAEWFRSNISLLYKSLGALQGKCRGCGVEIYWLVTKNHKKAPFTKDGLNHFADCPKKNLFR